MRSEHTDMLNAEQEQKLRELVKAFLEENAKINLSSHRTEEECWTHHILDSLMFLEVEQQLKLAPGSKIFDLGTGGGFPLLPLAILHPELACTGLDSTAKKIAAVIRIAEAMKIPNVTLLTGRAEVVGREPAHREAYDVILSRGVAALPLLLEYCSPFVNVGGSIVLWKSMKIDEELERGKHAARKLGCTYITSHRYNISELGERQLLMFKKTKPIGKDYPRPVGAAKKNPLSRN